MKHDLTTGNVTKTMLLFAVPMILGNLLQQLYNIADTLIVGKYLGSGPLAAVGASYTLMVFLTSIILGLCMGCGVVFSQLMGAKKEKELKNSLYIAFLITGSAACMIQFSAVYFLEPIMNALQIPEEIYGMTKDYLQIIVWGIGFIFLYNYFSALLRGLGNSLIPLLSLGISASLNIVLDLVFVIVFHWGVKGAAAATVLSQGISALFLIIYCCSTLEILHLTREDLHFSPCLLREIAGYSLLTCAQQSVMNFGILMIQGLVNSFGITVMAAFAAAVKIDSFAYMPVQDFGNAFSTFIAQNYGAKKMDRIHRGIRSALFLVFIFCLILSAFVFLFAKQLMLIFIQPKEIQVIAEGVRYLRIEGACYLGIGCLFFLYGLYRGCGKPAMSLILTVISLGLRVILAYTLAPIPFIGLAGIWWAIPIGWVIADIVGIAYYIRLSRSWKQK